MPRFNCLICGKFVSNHNIGRKVIVCDKCREGTNITPVVRKMVVGRVTTRKNRPCMHCNSTHVEFRVRTKDLYCRNCKGVTPVQREHTISFK
jgi:hypothetical protein